MQHMLLRGIGEIVALMDKKDFKDYQQVRRPPHLGWLCRLTSGLIDCGWVRPVTWRNGHIIFHPVWHTSNIVWRPAGEMAVFSQKWSYDLWRLLRAAFDPSIGLKLPQHTSPFTRRLYEIPGLVQALGVPTQHWLYSILVKPRHWSGRSALKSIHINRRRVWAKRGATVISAT